MAIPLGNEKMLSRAQDKNQRPRDKPAAEKQREKRMTNENTPPPQRPPLSNTLMLSGGAIAVGLLAVLTGAGIIPTSSGRSLFTLAAGMVFIFAGLMVLVRDLAGAKNKEDLPANAPVFLRLSASILNVLLLGVVGALASAFALGFVPDQLGASGMGLRIIAGAFALILWYSVFYLASGLKNKG